MTVIVVANPKGGVGKSTLATQISGLLASRGKLVTLGDLDRQQSSRQWLDIRPAHLARIEWFRHEPLTHRMLPRPPVALHLFLIHRDANAPWAKLRGIT